VAAGIVPLALGTDAGGSSRRPPAHVGVCGMKPTQDLIPYGPGFDESVWSISVICPIARDMGDIALAMQVLAGVSPGAAPALRIAAAPTFGTTQAVEPDVAAQFGAAMVAIRAAGGTVDQAQIDWPANTTSHDILPIQFAGLAHLYGDRFRNTPDLFDPDIAVQIRAGLALSGAEVGAALQASHRMRATLRAALARHGIIATPTTPCPAWSADLSAPTHIAGKPAAPRDHAAFTPQCNHAGVPALSLPCGTAANGMPLGLQLIAGPGQDAALIAMALAVEPVLRGLP
jgi:aspartyl-tRNA(Asn)/glutamyl-tRNA(Gln) amidotransferase subunit A